MQKYFYQPLTLPGVLAMLLIAIWFLLFVLKKGGKRKIGLFVLAHGFMHIDLWLLESKCFFGIACTILLFSIIAAVIRWLRCKKMSTKLLVFNRIYLFFTIILVFLAVYYILLSEAISILLLR